MADEFGEEHSFYIWPLDVEEGDPYPDDFHERVHAALRAAGFGCEST